MAIEYMELKQMKSIAATKNLAYGKRIPIKSIYIGLILDVIIPFTFGIITLSLKKIYGDIILYIPLKEYGE